jgi:hypothetical protein
VEIRKVDERPLGGEERTRSGGSGRGVSKLARS